MDDWDFSPRSIVVYELGEERPSLVLRADGEPFLLTKKNKIGFDLTPKGVINAKQT